MSLHKDCADYLRSYVRAVTGGKLGAGHAHELVAAYFGYGTGAALRAEATYPLSSLGQAEILIPDLRLMDQRVQELDGLPDDLPPVDDLASNLSNFLNERSYFSGDIWHTRDLEEHINVAYIQENPMMIEDDLSDQMAETNAYFDELYIDEVVLNSEDDALIANVSGSLNGENDPDRTFLGNSIAFTTVMTFRRVAGRVAYEKPELETSGAVDDSHYYDEEDA